MIVTILFYIFAVILTGSALAVILLRNPVHSVLFLILAFFNAAGLFVIMGAEFLAMILVIVYVGAVAVLFLFVVMMLNVDVESFRRGLSKYSTVGFIVAGILLAQMVLLFTGMNHVGRIAYNIALPIKDNIGNTQAIGAVLYTDYVLPFEVSGMILLVAMIGAIVLCFTPRDHMRRQNINAQVNRKVRDSMEIIKVESGKGVNT